MSDICILTTFFNPFNSQTRINNFYKFLENISNCVDLDDFYLLEIVSNRQKQQIKNCKSLILKNDSMVWQKESGLNYLLKNINLSKYSKILIVDCDVIFEDHTWIKKTSTLLDNYHLCQPFRTINYMNFDYTNIDSSVDGVVYSYLTKNKDAQYGNGGLAVGYSKEYVNHMEGFFEKSVVGGGDTLNILPFLYDCNLNLNIFDNLMKDIKVEYFEYLIKARNYVAENKSKKHCFFADYTVQHLFHGNLADRQYQSRYNYVNKHNYYENFEKDQNGLIKYKEDSSIKNIIENYFESRKENFKDSDPTVWCNIKHEIEELDCNKFMWLSDQNKFLFRNISEIKILLEKTEEVEKSNLYFNDSIAPINFDNNNQTEILIGNPVKIEIFSDYFIPKVIGRNPDTRRLSIMLKKIEIKPFGKDNYEDYPLENIL